MGHATRTFGYFAVQSGIRGVLTHAACSPACRVFTPIQKARVAAVCYPAFPDVIALVRLGAAAEERSRQQQKQQAMPDPMSPPQRC